MSKIVADLHIHSRFARACSKALNLKTIDAACRVKGVQLVSTGDCTHPLWMEEIERDLEEEGNGFLRLRGTDGTVKFILGSEVSCIYTFKGKVRRVHLCLYFSSIADAKKFNKALVHRGRNIHSDGRPIIGLSSQEVLRIMLEINPVSMMIPAHAWTPWFAVFGSKSGFDSLEECFDDLTPEIFAIETGLSSDPPMNWRLSALDNITLVSNSDAHSLPNLAREANVFAGDIAEFSYTELRRILKEKDRSKFLYTIEFYPEEGMYHFDGHRACGVRMSPQETKKRKGVCPKCKKQLTIGVVYRVDAIADRPEGFKPPHAIPYKSLVELDKIIAESFGVKSRANPRVQAEHAKIIAACGNELQVLIDTPYMELAPTTTSQVVEGIRRVRERELFVEPGFDGQYGTVKIFSDSKRHTSSQESLFED